MFLAFFDAGPAVPAEPTVGKTVPQSSHSSASKDDERRSQLAALKDKDPKVRRQAAEALGRLGDKAAVEPLIAALKDDDRGVRWSAASALGALADNRAVEPLIAALKDQDAWVRGMVAEALGRLGDRRAVEPLRAVLKRDDGSVDESAACALAALVKDETAVEPLLAALEHPSSEWTPLMVFGSIMQIGPPAVKPLAAALPRSCEKVRMNIVLALTHLGDDGAVEPLIKALADPNGDVARAAACGLAELDDLRALAPLTAAIKDSHSALWRPEEFTPRDKLTDRLPALATGMPADLAPLVSAMEDPHWQLRYSAAWVLGRLGDKRATEPLATVLKSAERAPTLEGVWLCGQALARLQSPLGIAPLIRVVKDHDADDRHQEDADSGGLQWARRMRQKGISKTIEAFAAIGPAAVDPLMASLKDENPGVRAVSAQALGRLGDKRAIDALKAASNDPSQRVRDSAAEAIRVINLNTPR
jgi:HEAT repeat protein